MRLRTGQLNPSESIRADSDESRAALKQYIEIQKTFTALLTKEQLSLLDDLQAQKNLIVSYEMFEAFRIGFEIAAGIYCEMCRE